MTPYLHRPACHHLFHVLYALRRRDTARQIRPDGSGLRKLFDSAGGLSAHPQFSPDSQRIVFTSDHAGAWPAALAYPPAWLWPSR